VLPVIITGMDDRVEQLSCRIDRYRGYLREGLNKDLIAFYLRQIAHHEAQLKRAGSEPVEVSISKREANS
jgi:hypothetical protein